MAKSFDLDHRGRRIVCDVHLSNCLLFAIVAAWQCGGKVRAERGALIWGLVPHWYCETPAGHRHEFVWGLAGWRAPWILFKGYGVEAVRD